MKYNIGDKTVNIPDTEIDTAMKALEITKEEAIEMWLDDHDYTVNEEQEALDKAAAGVMKAKADKKVREAKPRVAKVSDEKKYIFDSLAIFLSCTDPRYETEIIKENKLIQITMNGKVFKLDLVEQRQKKS